MKKVWKFFWHWLSRMICDVEECQYFAFFLGFNFSTRDKMGMPSTLSAPCHQHVPDRLLGAWRWWTVELVVRVSSNLTGSHCNLLSGGTLSELLMDDKAIPAHQRTGKICGHPLTGHTWHAALHWKHSLCHWCRHGAWGIMEQNKKLFILLGLVFQPTDWEVP